MIVHHLLTSSKKRLSAAAAVVAKCSVLGNDNFHRSNDPKAGMIRAVGASSSAAAAADNKAKRRFLGVSRRRAAAGCTSFHGWVQLILLSAMLVVALWSVLFLPLTNRQSRLQDPDTGAVGSHQQDALSSFSLKGDQKKNRFLNSPSLDHQSHSHDSHNNRYHYPMGNRSLLLSDQPLCAAAVQATAWSAKAGKEDSSKTMNNDKTPDWALRPNPNCPQRWQQQERATTDNNQKNNKKITLALIYYQDMALLSRMLDSWLTWPAHVRDEFEFLIIDDGSQVGFRAVDLIGPVLSWQQQRGHGQKQQPESNIPLLSTLDLTLYEIEQDLAWNIGGARNLAHTVAAANFVLTTDTDVYMNATVASFLLETLDAAMKEQQQQPEDTQSNNNMNIIWKFLYQLLPDGQTFEPHPAVMLASKQAYWLLGGCDEDLVGHYGQTDILFLWKAGRDTRVHVHALTEAMRERDLFVQKIGRPLNKQCMAWATPRCPTMRPFGKPQPRVLRHNMEILGRKKRREVAFSNKFLRFGWHRVELGSMGD